MKKLTHASITAFIGAAVVSSFTSVVNAEEPAPFAMNELANGYMQAAQADPSLMPQTAPAATTKPATTGVKPITVKTTKAPAHPTANAAAAPSVAVKPTTCPEGKCGDMMKPAATSAAAATDDKAAEGKCGEGKCAAMMENGHMKAGMEGMCGGMMKGKEGSCGMMMNMPATESAPGAKSAEGKCGEGKCAAMMENGQMKSGMEGACGAMMKGKEGACGSAVSAPQAAPAKPVEAAPKPAAPAAAPENKLVEGQCAAVKEESHDKPKVHVDKSGNLPWGNRKKVVNP